MKLELKHLAGYLPYGLEFYVPFLIWSGNPPEPSHEEYGGQEMDCKNINKLIESGFPPILRPLSDLTKEIEVNGEKFVPYQKMHLTLSYVEEFLNEDLWIGQYWDFEKVELLMQWHFDIYGLIENNLAIDKNTTL